MNSKDLNLNSVNWEHGMLLTPDHFLRQERYTDSTFLWLLRYASNSFGLVGGGPRIAENELGVARFDPIVTLTQDEQSLTISVTQCRGITPAGCIVEVTPENPVLRKFALSDLEGVKEAPVYLVAAPHEKEAADGLRDEFNPQMQTERRIAYRLSLQPAPDQMAYALVAAQIRPLRYGSGYEKDAEFIPACTTMAAHSELAAGYRQILTQVTFLAERYSELHRAMREYLLLFTERGIETEVDVQTVQFVDRMVMSLQDCVYELLDYTQAPSRFFGQLRRFLHAAAVYFDLTPGMQGYFETLKETGETEFIQLLEQQKSVLRTTRTWKVNANLGSEVRSAVASLTALQRLERALEGKYLDFRVSPQLEAMNFVFDRGGNVLFKIAAKPSRVQGLGDDLIIFFSQMRLEGRDRYRLVLVGESGAVFEKGSRITVEIRINEGSGFQRAPVNLSCEATVPGQRNFEYDFEAPDVPTITDLKVAIQAHHPIKTALLFNRHRFYAGRQQDAGRRVRAVEPLVENKPALQAAESWPLDDMDKTSSSQPQPQRLTPQSTPVGGATPVNTPPQQEETPRQRAPWEFFKRPEMPQPEAPPATPKPRFDQDDDQPKPPRRRRLE